MEKDNKEKMPNRFRFLDIYVVFCQNTHKYFVLFVGITD